MATLMGEMMSLMGEMMSVSRVRWCDGTTDKGILDLSITGAVLS